MSTLSDRYYLLITIFLMVLSLLAARQYYTAKFKQKLLEVEQKFAEYLRKLDKENERLRKRKLT